MDLNVLPCNFLFSPSAALNNHLSDLALDSPLCILTPASFCATVFSCPDLGVLIVISPSAASFKSILVSGLGSRQPLHTDLEVILCNMPWLYRVCLKFRTFWTFDVLLVLKESVFWISAPIFVLLFYKSDLSFVQDRYVDMLILGKPSPDHSWSICFLKNPYPGFQHQVFVIFTGRLFKIVMLTCRSWAGLVDDDTEIVESSYSSKIFFNYIFLFSSFYSSLTPVLRRANVRRTKTGSTRGPLTWTRTIQSPRQTSP